MGMFVYNVVASIWIDDRSIDQPVTLWVWVWTWTKNYVAVETRIRDVGLKTTAHVYRKHDTKQTYRMRIQP